MALKIKYKHPTGIDIEQSYVRVDNVNSNKNKINFQVKYYVNEKMANPDAIPPKEVDGQIIEQLQPKPIEFFSKTFWCDYSIDGANPIAQAYAYLKTLPEFADAVDC